MTEEMHGDYSGEGEVIAFSPTRENAAGALDMVRSFYATVHRTHTEVILVIDHDDPQMEEYKAIPETMRRELVGMGITRPDPPRLMFVEGGSLTKATNEAVVRIWDDDVIIGHVGDDHRFMTPGWDTAIRNKLLAEPGVAYAYDGFKSKWASAWWTNSIIPRTLGWFALPGTLHLCIDDVYMNLGAGLGRLHYMPELLIEHLHPAGGKVEWRDIVKSHYEPTKFRAQKRVLERYMQRQYTADIKQLRELLGIPLGHTQDVSNLPKSAAELVTQLVERANWVPKDPGAVIVVPFRDAGNRKRSFDKVTSHLAPLGLPIYVGDNYAPEFSRSAARNDGVDQADEWDVVVFNDADCLMSHEDILEGIRVARETQRMVIPHSRLWELNRDKTDLVINWVFGSWPKDGESRKRPSGVVIFPRAVWEAVGGYDERFTGWGFEDAAIMMAAEVLTGEPVRLDNDMWHLWHQPSRGTVIPAERDIFQQYQDAKKNEDRDAMPRGTLAQ